MFQEQKKDVIILGVDIDDTLIPSQVADRVIFNGGHCLWVRTITKLQATCAKFNIRLIPQLISSKENAEADLTTNVIMKNAELRAVFCSRKADMTIDVCDPLRANTA